MSRRASNPPSKWLQPAFPTFCTFCDNVSVDLPLWLSWRSFLCRTCRSLLRTEHEDPFRREGIRFDDRWSDLPRRRSSDARSCVALWSSCFAQFLLAFFLPPELQPRVLFALRQTGHINSFLLDLLLLTCHTPAVVDRKDLENIESLDQKIIDSCSVLMDEDTESLLECPPFARDSEIYCVPLFSLNLKNNWSFVHIWTWS